jgi:hypothetical protein
VCLPAGAGREVEQGAGPAAASFPNAIAQSPSISVSV